MGNLKVVSEPYESCGFCGRPLENGLRAVKSKIDQGKYNCQNHYCNAVICRECITEAFTLIEEGRET
jgi:hypothetical protein